MYSLADSWLIGTLAAQSGNTSVIAVDYDQTTGVYGKAGKLNGIATIAVDIRGSFTATMVFEATVDGTNWVSVTGFPSGGGAGVTTATTTGLWFFSVAGYRNFRVRCTAFTSAPTVGIRQTVADHGGPQDIPLANYIQGNPAAITDNTAHDVVAAQAAGIRTYVTTVLVTNSHATVGTLVTLTNGSGGSTLCQGYAAAAGGGFALNFDPPLATSAATALSAICGTTGSNIYISVNGYIA